MNKFPIYLVLSALMTSVIVAEDGKDSAKKELYSGKLIQALLITDGCCHNYLFQSAALTSGVEAQADIEWTVVRDGGTGTAAEIDLYKDPDWAKPYDVTKEEQPVVWVNDFHGTRVFGTTYGHSDDTFRDPVFINLLARGIVWAAGKLEE